MTRPLTKKQRERLQRCYRCEKPLYRDDVCGVQYCKNADCSKYEPDHPHDLLPPKEPA